MASPGYAGQAKPGEYLGKVEAVGFSRARGGAVVWHIHWKLAGVAAVFVEDLVVSNIDRPLAPAWHRIASILASNGRALLYKHEGAIRSALIGCTARLTFAPGASGFVVTGITAFTCAHRAGRAASQRRSVLMAAERRARMPLALRSGAELPDAIASELACARPPLRRLATDGSTAARCRSAPRPERRPRPRTH